MELNIYYDGHIYYILEPGPNPGVYYKNNNDLEDILIMPLIFAITQAIFDVLIYN